MEKCSYGGTSGGNSGQVSGGSNHQWQNVNMVFGRKKMATQELVMDDSTGKAMGI